MGRRNLPTEEMSSLHKEALLRYNAYMAQLEKFALEQSSSMEGLRVSVEHEKREGGSFFSTKKTEKERVAFCSAMSGDLGRSTKAFDAVKERVVEVKKTHPPFPAVTEGKTADQIAREMVAESIGIPVNERKNFQLPEKMNVESLNTALRSAPEGTIAHDLRMANRSAVTVLEDIKQAKPSGKELNAQLQKTTHEVKDKNPGMLSRAWNWICKNPIKTLLAVGAVAGYVTLAVLSGGIVPAAHLIGHAAGTAAMAAYSSVKSGAALHAIKTAGVAAEHAFTSKGVIGHAFTAKGAAANVTAAHQAVASKVGGDVAGWAVMGGGAAVAAVGVKKVGSAFLRAREAKQEKKKSYVERAGERTKEKDAPLEAPALGKK